MKCKICGIEEIDVLDPKKELCNEHYIQIDEFNERKLRFFFEIDIDCNKNSPNEFREFLWNLAHQINGMESFNIVIAKTNTNMELKVKTT